VCCRKIGVFLDVGDFVKGLCVWIVGGFCGGVGFLGWGVGGSVFWW